MQSNRAYSLIEVILALGVLGFALLSVLALLPIALQTSGDSVHETRTSMIAQDAALHVQKLAMNESGANPAVSFTLWYDADGRRLTNSPGNYNAAFYRVDAKQDALSSYPPFTDPADRSPANMYSAQLSGMSVGIGWPVDTASGELPPGKALQVHYSFYVRKIPDL